MDKTLTISIAAYNVEKYIRQCLDSLIDEDIIDDLEIFVIDDGGTDHTLQIAQEYAAKYPQSIFPVHKENGGYGSTINKGIELATGKYFKQLDGDDWYETENLKTFINVLKTVSVDCVLTDTVMHFETDDREKCFSLYNYIDDGIYTLVSSGIHDRPTMYASTYRTKILKNMPERLDEHCFYTDIEYSAFPISHLETLYVLHEPIYTYRISSEGQSMNPEGIVKHYKEHEYVFWRLYDIYNKIPDDRVVNKKMFWALLLTRFIEHIRFLCVLPASGKSKNELINFMQQAQKGCPDLLNEAMKKSRTINLLMRSNYALYRPLSKRIRYNWRKG